MEGKNMNFALFLGCNIPARLKEYDLSSRAVLRALGVELVDIREFNCCGYPVRNFDFRTFILSAARNLALAEKRGLDMMTLCKCCYGSLKKADHALKNDHLLREETNAFLSREGLAYSGGIEVKHLLSVLFHDIGLDRIGNHISRPFRGLKIATHYGCHALRPSRVVQFDDPVNPTLFDQLVETTGAETVYWAARLECCGAPLLGINDELSTDLTRKKLAAGKEAGADYLCTACPYCQLQFDMVRQSTGYGIGDNHVVPPILFTELLSLCMGMDRNELGFGALEEQRPGIETFLSQVKK
jgi:heterodisulfide reductase subunit B